MSITTKCTCGMSSSGFCLSGIKECKRHFGMPPLEEPILSDEDMKAWEKSQKTLTPFEENVLEKTFQRSLKDKPGSFYQPLFDHMNQEHRLILLDSEMADIIHLVEKMQEVKLTPEQIEERKKAIDWYRNPGAEQVQQGAVWVKAYNGMPDGIYNMKVASKIWHVVMLGVGSVVGGEIVLITFLNKTTFGKEDVQKEDVTVYYLYENPAPAKESDVVEFAEWLLNSRILPMPNYGNWGCFENDTTYSTEQLCELFIKQKEVKP